MILHGGGGTPILIQFPNVFFSNVAAPISFVVTMSFLEAFLSFAYSFWCESTLSLSGSCPNWHLHIAPCTTICFSAMVKILYLKLLLCLNIHFQIQDGRRRNSS